MWENYLESLGENSSNTDKKYTAWHFCDDEHDANPTNNFVDSGNTYYTNYLATAKRLGITEGVGNKIPHKI